MKEGEKKRCAANYFFAKEETIFEMELFCQRRKGAPQKNISTIFEMELFCQRKKGVLQTIFSKGNHHIG